MRELCDSLLGPLDQPSATPRATPGATPSAPPGALPGTSPVAAGGGAGGGVAGGVTATVAEEHRAPPLLWQPSVLDLCKRTLLREVVLPTLSTNRALQRILAEYVEQLDAIVVGIAQ